MLRFPLMDPCDVESMIRRIKDHLRTHNIQSMTPHTVGPTRYLIIGEEHGHKEKIMRTTTPTFSQLLQQLDQECHCPIDLYVEGAWEHREESRHKQHWTTPEKVMEEFDGDSLDVIRVAVQRCSKIRVHTIDVRFPHVLNAFESLGDDQLWSDLKWNAELMKCLTNKNKHKIQNETLQRFVDDQLRGTLEQVDKIATRSNHTRADAWDGFSRLNEPYTLARMLREFNGPLCVFYGGDNHAQRLNEAFDTLLAKYTSTAATT